ncbi:MAG: hypothetical protein J3Q66DRAFT_370568 [Benniella sp.]|nr:MAG: hypothetical protein J3Q66DRAFT_370568 [Benniella sp.]
MVLSAIWTLAFGAHNPLPEFPDEAILDDSQDDTLAQDRDNNDNEANIARIHERQRAVIEAERDILATTVYLPIPNIRDESAENKTSFILVVTSFTLNNIGCYPFFGFRDRHQAFLNTIVGRLRQRSRKVLRKPLIHLSTRINKSSKSAVHPPPPPLLNPVPLATSNGIGASTAANIANDISATIMAAMPTLSPSSPPSTTSAVNRARKGLRYLSITTPRNPTFLQEFYPEMVCAMTSSMVTRVLLYPFDTIASRVSAQGASFPWIGHAPTPYKGFWDCWIQSIRPSGGGIMGLYSGLVDCIIIEAMMRWVVLEGTWFAHLVVQWIYRR